MIHSCSFGNLKVGGEERWPSITYDSVPSHENPAEWPGERGRGYVPDATKEQVDKTFPIHNFNVIASEKIALNRSIPDSREKQ